jgi:hypothetical protein
MFKLVATERTSGTAVLRVLSTSLMHAYLVHSEASLCSAVHLVGPSLAFHATEALLAEVDLS